MKVKYLIIEDEIVPAQRLKSLVEQLRPQYISLGIVESVEDAVASIKSQKPDLILMDIELADGSCFEIFEYAQVEVPVIFTTAYSEYSIKAFKVNSMDYLLKPIRKSELETALSKYEKLETKNISNRGLYDKFSSGAPKKRLLISRGDGYYSLDISTAAYFRSEDKYTYVRTFCGKDYIVDLTLNRLTELLDSEQFFRISRNYIVSLDSINDVRKFFDGRLKVTLNSPSADEIIVSAARRDDFLRWMGAEIA